MSASEIYDIKCIFCGKNSTEGEEYQITEEHVIPKMLGGFLTIPFVCKRCNTYCIGSQIEAELKKNGYIVAAIDQLSLQSKAKAYRQADIRMDFEQVKNLIAKYDDKGNANYPSQTIEDGSMIATENEAKEILRKQIERYEKSTGTNVSFNIDDYDKLPYNLVIPVYPSDICFIKRKDQKATVKISGLGEPISFKIPAIIAFEHLAGLYYPFVMKSEFDPIRKWIFDDGNNCHVLLNSHLSDRQPNEIEYLPYHHVRIGFQNGGLTAIVGLFGVIKFSVFLAELENLNDFPQPDIFDYYHVYDINKKELIPHSGRDLREDDDMLMKSVSVWGKYELNKS